MKPANYGLTCWNHRNCDSVSPPGETADDCDLRAMVVGWKMGLDSDGQAHYSCLGCAPCLYNVHEHVPLGWWQAGRVPNPFYPHLTKRVSGEAQLWHELETGAWYANGVGERDGN